MDIRVHDVLLCLRDNGLYNILREPESLAEQLAGDGLDHLEARHRHVPPQAALGLFGGPAAPDALVLDLDDVDEAGLGKVVLEFARDLKVATLGGGAGLRQVAPLV